MIQVVCKIIEFTTKPTALNQLSVPQRDCDILSLLSSEDILMKIAFFSSHFLDISARKNQIKVWKWTRWSISSWLVLCIWYWHVWKQHENQLREYTMSRKQLVRFLACIRFIQTDTCIIHRAQKTKVILHLCSFKILWSKEGNVLFNDSFNCWMHR